MSANLSEETPGKTIAAQGYGIRQLFRRPMPKTDTDQPYAIITYLSADSIASNTPVAFANLANDWDDCYVSDTNLFDVDLPNGRILFLEDGNNLRAPGLYIAHAAVAWTDPITGPMYVSVNWQINTFEAIEDQVSGAPGQGGNTHIVTGEDSLCTSLALVQTDNTGHNNWVTGSLLQVGGVARSINQITLKVARISAYPGAAGAFCPL